MDSFSHPAFAVEYSDLMSIDYLNAWDLQESIHNELYQAKEKGNSVPFRLLFCEHPHVYTLGKSGKESNLLAGNKELEHIGATFVHTNRGGDITYHGPGQIVGYPIIDLTAMGIGIRKYMYLLEESIILLLKEYGITAERLEGATGVWLDSVGSHARKICAMGVRVSRGITMHGFAFNVNTDLKYFSYINPCGFTDKSVTSLQREMGRELPVQLVKNQLKTILLKQLNLIEQHG